MIPGKNIGRGVGEGMGAYDEGALILQGVGEGGVVLYTQSDAKMKELICNLL